MKIELQKASSKTERGFDRDRGRKAIVVDGVTWGYANMTPRGMHGSCYWFEQIGRNGVPICRIVKSKFGDKKDRHVEANVWGDKHARRRNNDSRPLTERLLEEAWSLVKEGLLRHPDVVAEENRKSGEAVLAARERVEAEQKAAFTAAARSAAEPFERLIAKHEFAALVAAIEKAMRWAQTQ